MISNLNHIKPFVLIKKHLILIEALISKYMDPILVVTKHAMMSRKFVLFI